MIEQVALEMAKEKIVETGEKYLENKLLEQVAVKDKLGTINKEFNKDFLDKSREGVYKKEVGCKIDKSLVPEYLSEVEKITNREIKPIQMSKLTEALRQQDFEKITPEKLKLHKKLFNNCKDKLIEQWEKSTGDEWPRYKDDVYNDKGEVIRVKGQPYDAHHLVEASFGGPNEWWNMHPAAFPNEHQNRIHQSNITKLLFG